MQGKKATIKLEGVMVTKTGLATSIMLDGDMRVAANALPALIAAVISNKNSKDRKLCAADLMKIMTNTISHLEKLEEA